MSQNGLMDNFPIIVITSEDSTENEVDVYKRQMLTPPKTISEDT